MSIELTIPGLFLSDYSDRIKINEKYNTETGVILSEYGKNRIVDSLLHTLSIEEGLYDRNQIPDDNKGKRKLLRALLNIRPPSQIKNSFLTKIDQLLQYELRHKIIVTCNNICSASVKFSPADIKNGNILFLWKGDITCLKVDAIVNAANDKPASSCTTRRAARLSFRPGRVSRLNASRAGFRGGRLSLEEDKKHVQPRRQNDDGETAKRKDFGCNLEGGLEHVPADRQNQNRSGDDYQFRGRNPEQICNRVQEFHTTSPVLITVRTRLTPNR